MYKIILAGCGSMCRAWLEVIKKRGDCIFVGFADPIAANAEKVRDEYGLTASIYGDIDSALEAETANLVIDVTVPEAHAGVVTAALSAGCDVFGEKPMSDTLEDAERMVNVADGTGKNYFVMQNRRYTAGIAALKRFLSSGELGKIGQVSADFRLSPRFGGFRDEMDSPLLADMAIHTFDAARFITGRNAVSVYCREFNPEWSWYKGSASAVALFDMEDGIVFDYRGSWCANGLNTSWESEWRVACERGAVFWDGSSKLHYGLADGGGVTDIPIPQMEGEGHAACIADMFDALESGTRTQTDCRDNINSIRMVHKAIESAKNRQNIKI